MSGPWEQFQTSGGSSPEASGPWMQYSSSSPAAKSSSLVHQTSSDVSALADMALSFPGALFGLGANIGARTVGALAGEDHKKVSQEAQAIGQSVAEPFSNPIKKLMAMAGHKDGYDESVVSQTLNKAQSWLSKGGEWVEKHTKGALVKEDVEDLANEVALLAGVKAPKINAKTIQKDLNTQRQATPYKFDESIKGHLDEKPDLDARAAAEKAHADTAANIEFASHAKQTEFPFSTTVEEIAARHNEETPQLDLFVGKNKDVTPTPKELLSGTRNLTESQIVRKTSLINNLMLSLSNGGKLTADMVKGEETKLPVKSPLESAVDKISSGRSFELDAVEKVTWDKAKKTLASADPEYSKLSEKEIGAKLADRSWVKSAIDKAKQMESMFADIAKRSKDTEAVKTAQKRREVLLQQVEDLQELLQKPRPVKGSGQGPKTREFQASLLKGKQSGGISPASMTLLGASTVGYALNQDDPISGALFGLAAGALLNKGIGSITKSGMRSAEFAKVGEEFWKPDFNQVLNPRYLERAFKWTRSGATADSTTLFQHIENLQKMGVTPEMDRKFRDFSEGSVKSLTPKEKELYESGIQPLQKVMAEELNKIQDPHERQVVAEEIKTRLARNHRAWWESVSSSREVAGPGGFQRSPSSTKGRTVYSLEDGTIITTKPIEGGGWNVTAWKNNQPTILGVNDVPLKSGDTFKGSKIVEAKQADIETNTPVRYVESDLATHALKVAELMKYNRERTMVEELLNSPGSKDMFMKQGAGPIPSEWVRPPGADSISQLRDVYMPKEYAEVISDYLKNNAGSGSILEGVKNIMIRAMMLNPYPHIMNEFVHWYDSRGIGGFITPSGLSGSSLGLSGLAKTLPDAIRSVLVQDKFQTEMQKSGGQLLFPSVRNSGKWKDIMQMGLTDAVKTGDFKEMAFALGTTAPRLALRISDMGSTIMWASRDVLYTQLVKEQMLMGKTTNEAVLEVGKHMPEYFVPSRIITKGESGRVMSKIFNNPLMNVFAPYHYGLVRAVGEIGKELTSGKSPEIAKGLDRAAALLVGFTVMYPLMDKLLQAMTGNEDAHQRRAGPYHVANAIGETMDGKKDASSILMSLITPNPAPQAVFELMQNRYISTGQLIRHPGNSVMTQSLDTGRFVGSKLAPAQAAISNAEGKLSWEEYLYRQMDVIATPADKLARQEKARANQRKAGRRHEKELEKAYGYESTGD